MSERIPLNDICDEDYQRMLDHLEGSACMTCRHWEPYNDPCYDETVKAFAGKTEEEVSDDPIFILFCIKYKGFCRCNPPQLTPVAIPQDIVGTCQGIWPLTKWNDWCGKYEENPI